MESGGTPCPTCGYRKDPGFTKKVLQFSLLFAILGALWLYFLMTNAAEKKDAPPVRDATGQIVTSP
jgi:hypothetical protein